MTADSEALVFKPPEYLSHTVASAAEALAFQVSFLANKRTVARRDAVHAERVTVSRGSSPVSMVSAIPRAPVNARLSMKTAAGAAPSVGGGGQKKPRLEKLPELVSPVSRALPATSSATAAAAIPATIQSGAGKIRNQPSHAEAPQAFRRAKPQLFEQ